MKKVIICLVILLPILIFVDFKLEVGGNINVGFKDFAIILIAISVIRKKTFILLLKNTTLKLFGLFLLSTLLSNFLLGNIGNSLVSIIRLSEAFVVIIGVNYILQKKSEIILYKSIIISCVICSLQVFSDVFLKTDLTKNTIGALSGMWLAVGALIIFYNFLKLSWPKYVKIFFCLLFISASLISEKRTWIMITLFIICISIIKSINLSKIAGVSSIIIVAILTFFIISPSAIKVDRFSEVIDALSTLEIDNVNSLSSRFNRWNTSINIIDDNWFLGVGYENVDLNLPSYINTDNPDNLYLELWLQNGLFALIFFLILLFHSRNIKVYSTTFLSNQKFLKATFLLFIIGGITWSYMVGYGIILFSILVGIRSSKNLYSYSTS